MRRNFYSDYVEHCIRFYAKNPEPVIHSLSQANDWSASDKVIKSLSPNNRKMVLTIFREGDTVPDNVYKYCKTNRLQQDSVWKVINHTMKQVAIERGLL